MRFRVKRIDLTEELGVETSSGTAAWVEVPLGVTEGFINAVGALRGVDEKGEVIDPGARKGNLLMLEQILAWNLDDAKGKPLKLVKDVPEANLEGRLAILSQLPVDLFALLADTMLNGPKMSERAEGNSKTSSEP